MAIKLHCALHSSVKLNADVAVILTQAVMKMLNAALAAQQFVAQRPPLLQPVIVAAAWPQLVHVRAANREKMMSMRQQLLEGRVLTEAKRALLRRCEEDGALLAVARCTPVLGR